MFGNRPKFLVEVESGKFGASLDPDCEPSRMKQVSEAWKKDYGARPWETKTSLVSEARGDSFSELLNITSDILNIAYNYKEIGLCTEA